MKNFTVNISHLSFRVSLNASDNHRNIIQQYDDSVCMSVTAITVEMIVIVRQKVKFSHTRYRALGLELIRVYCQSARR